MMNNANLKGYDSIFAKRLRELIETKGIKHGDLADKDVLNVSRQAIGQYCNGTALPPADKIVILAQYFNVSADYLLGLSDAKTTDTDLKMIVDYTGLSEEAVICLHEKCCKKMEVISKKAKKRYDKTRITQLQNIYKERYIDNASELFILSEFIINKNSLLQNCNEYIKHQRTKTKIEKYINTISNNNDNGYKMFVESSHAAIQTRIGDCEYKLFQIQQLMLSFINALKNKVIDKDITDIKSNEALFYSTDIEYLKECVNLFYKMDVNRDVNNDNDK